MSGDQDQAEPPDSELLMAVAKGDTNAFSCFYDRLSGTLFSVALSILRDPAQAEDVLQEVFFQIWERAAHFDPALGKPLSWAVAMTRNKSIDRLRGSQRRQKAMEQMTQELPDEGFGAESAGVGGESAGLVRASLQKLPEDQRKAIEMAFFLGLSHGEIAEKLAAPLGTIKARIRRGMIQLRGELRELI